VADKKLSRFGFIDAVRGIAACAVMLQHSLYASKLLGNFPTAPLNGFIPTWLELGETGVVAFFLVSGFVIPLSLEKTANFSRFWLHRILRIYPLYITVIVVGVAQYWSTFVHNPSVLMKTVGAHLVFMQEYLHVKELVGGSWTLSLEMIWYIIVSGLFLVALNRRLWPLLIGSVAVSLASCVVCALGHHVPMGRLSMLLCCVTGLVCYRYEQGDITKSIFFGLLALMGSVITLNLAIGDAIFPGPHPTSSFPMAFDSWALAALIFFGAFATRAAGVWNHSILAFLGRISYSVYLVHPIVLFVFALMAVQGFGLIICTFAATIAISTVTYRFVELPAIRFGHRRKANLVAATAPA